MPVMPVTLQGVAPSGLVAGRNGAGLLDDNVGFGGGTWRITFQSGSSRAGRG